MTQGEVDVEWFTAEVEVDLRETLVHENRAYYGALVLPDESHQLVDHCPLCLG